MIHALRLCSLAASVAVLAFAAVPASAATAAKTFKPIWSQLPDWSGTWSPSKSVWTRPVRSVRP